MRVRIAGWYGLVALVAGTLLVTQHSASGRASLAILSWTGVGLASLAVIVAAARYNAMGWLGHPVLAWLGRISYALYLWHFVVLWTIEYHLGLPIWVEVLVGIPISIGLATAPLVLVERPFLRLKRRLEPAGGDAASAIASRALATEPVSRP